MSYNLLCTTAILQGLKATASLEILQQVATTTTQAIGLAKFPETEAPLSVSYLCQVLSCSVLYTSGALSPHLAPSLHCCRNTEVLHKLAS